MPPPLRPVEASYKLVCNLTSDSDSGAGEKCSERTLKSFVAENAIASETNSDITRKRIAGVYYYLNGIMTERLLIVAPISGLIGAATELIPVWKLDDNLTCPVLSAVGLTALFYLYGGFA